MCIRDSDEEAVHLVELHAQVGDAGAGFFTPLQVKQKTIAIGLNGAQFVQLGVKTAGDHAAVAHQRGGGVIASGFDAELDELRAIQTNCDGFLLDLEGREKARTGIANLRVQFNKVHGFFIEVTQGQIDKVPDDYRRRQTLKNAERFITPELKAFEDKALSAQERALAREKWPVS